MDTLLENFGIEFIKQVRDNSLDDFEMIINGKMKSEEGLYFHNEIKKLSSEEIELIKKIILETNNNLLHKVLFFFETNEDYSIFHKNESVDLNDLSDGLSGELYGRRGWIKKYSKYPLEL